MEYVDLYQIHRWDPRTPIEETMEALHDVVRAGKARYIGASSMFSWQFAKAQYTAEAHGWTRFVSMQNHYNLIYREEEREMIPLCLDQGVGCIPWSPLARGVLAGNRTRDGGRHTTRSSTDAFTDYLYDQPTDFDVVDAVAEVAAAREVPPAQVALAWLLAKPGVSAPIVGATKKKHLKDALAAEALSCPRTRSPRSRSPTCPTPSSGTSRRSRRGWSDRVAAPGEAEPREIGGGMRVELTVADFLNRAALVYGAPNGGAWTSPRCRVPTGRSPTASSRPGRGGMALALDDLGVEHGERVAIVSPNSGRFLTAYFGVSGYGRMLVPINFRLTSDEIAYVVEHSGASVLLYDPDLADEVGSIKVAHRFCLDGADDAALFAPAADGRGAAAWEPQEDATCSVNYTSGTTARPKGVQLTQRNCWLNAATFGWHTGVSDRDVLLHTLPMFHCNGWGMPYAVTGMGGTPRRAAQGRRRGDPVADRAPRRDAALRRAGRRGGHPGARRRPGPPRAGPCPGAARYASSWPGHRRRRRRSSGWSPSSGGSSSRSTA